jgi:hypothetical protein
MLLPSMGNPSLLGFRWNHTPVLLTTSEEELDIVKSNHLQVNCYLSRPERLGVFESLAKRINGFWLTKVKLPPQRQSV